MATDSYDFDPEILRLQEQAPSPLPRAFLWTLMVLLLCLIVWVIFGRLDVVVVAHGKLIPQSSLKIIQPAESGIIEEILVEEGEEVVKGQVVALMDTGYSDADGKMLDNELHFKAIQLRRIAAELADKKFESEKGEEPNIFGQVFKQYLANRKVYKDTLSTAVSTKNRLSQELKSTIELKSKLSQTIPIFREQSNSYRKLSEKGYVSKMAAKDKERDLIEKEQDLKSQSHKVKSLQIEIEQAKRQIIQVTSTYRQQLQNEKVLTEVEHRKLLAQSDKQTHRHNLLKLRSPQSGVVKDMTTHTPGTVVNPGSILMTIVPNNEPVEAEVWVTHLDAGVVKPGLPVKTKLIAYPFQKYGMIEGEIKKISPDSFDVEETQKQGSQGYKAIVTLYDNYLEAGGNKYKLIPGMQVSAELSFGTRSVLEYLLSPIQTTVSEAGRER